MSNQSRAQKALRRQKFVTKDQKLRATAPVATKDNWGKLEKYLKAKSHAK